ncbi:MAG: CRISPR-associated endonuclease Cas1 [Bryobacteraceae bacterium]|nr:CRISPR-associated endonuclease Cas1 [Bryobacteraceae bacterium]
MATLYIDRSGAELELDHGALAVRLDGELQQRIPLLQLERCVIASGVRVSTGLLAGLAEAGIGVLILRPRQERAAVLAGVPQGDATRRLGQAAMALHLPTKDRWARFWVHAKCMSMARLLRTEAERQTAGRAALAGTAARIQAHARRLRQERLGSESARGVEGAASASYFEALRELFPPGLGFEGRNRRPPRDPVNACLSLFYTLLYGAAVEAATAAGLDPAIGFLHEPAPGRAGLACDLVEPFRAAADRVVAELFRTRVLRKEHFQITDGACLLGKAGRRLFYESAEPPLGRLRERMRRLARTVARAADRTYEQVAAQGGVTPCGRCT